MSSSKLQKLKELTENEFRQDIIIPLLLNMKYINVQDTHGADEFGKDVVCQYETGLQTLNTAIVVKKGDVSGSSAPDGEGRTLGIIREQIRMALSMQAEDLETKAPLTITNVIVWISGKFKSKARRQIAFDRSNSYVNIEFRDGAKTVELLDEYYPEYWTIGDHTIVNYFSSAREKHSKLEDILSLGSVHDEHRLPSIFVPPRLVRIESRRTVQAQQERRPPKKQAFEKLLEPSRDNLVLIGDFGTGKTTALRRMLLQTIDANERHFQKHPIPIYIRFRDLDFSSDTPITDALCAEFQRLAPSGTTTDIIGLLTAGNVLVLIDGLDELETDDGIVTAVGLLNSFSLTYIKSRIVITSRSLEILETTNVLTQFTLYRILHLNISQVKTMIRRWFADNVVEGEKLIREILNPITFTSIPLTPLTMAMLAAVYRGNSRDLPANVTELFDKYVGFALGQWDATKGIEHLIEWRIKRNLLCQVAWLMLRDKERSMALEDVTKIIDEKVTELGLPFQGTEIMAEIIERSGLLVPAENESYVFKHHAIFSYLAGNELVLQPDHFNTISDRFYDMTWSRTIFCAFGIKYNDPTYLQFVIDEIPIPSGNLLYYGIQLGMITQASYYVPNSIKSESLTRSLVGFVMAWDEMVSALSELRKQNETSRHISQFMLLNLMCVSVRNGLGAPILQRPLQTIANTVTSDDLAMYWSGSENYDTHFEWFSFVLAIACLSALELDTFDHILRSGKIRNPMLLACCKLHAEITLDELHDVAAELNTRLQDQMKYIGKRLRGRGDEIGKLFDQAPNPIALLPDTAAQRQLD